MSGRARPIAVFVSFSGHGGVERMVVNLIRGFVALGRQVDLVLVRAESPHLERLPRQVNRLHSGTQHTFAAVPTPPRCPAGGEGSGRARGGPSPVAGGH